MADVKVAATPAPEDGLLPTPGRKRRHGRRWPQKYIVRFRLSGFLKGEQAYILTEKQLALARRVGDVEIVCYTEANNDPHEAIVYKVVPELVVTMSLVEAARVSRVTPQMRLLECHVVDKQTLLRVLNRHPARATRSINEGAAQHKSNKE
jgi:hypothetical protein